MREENLPLNTPAAQALLGARDVIAEEAFQPNSKAFKRVVVSPDRNGIVVIRGDFIPDGDMDPITGEWVGWIPVRN